MALLSEGDKDTLVMCLWFQVSLAAFVISVF